MNEQKSLLTELSEAIDRYRAGRRAARGEQEISPSRPSRLHRFLRWLMPNGGTLLLVAALIATAQVWAKPLASPAGAPGPSATTVNYQGRLANPDGSPVTDGNYGMTFALYAASTGGSPVWGPESHAAVPVSEGLFSVGLGSQTSGGIPTTTWDGDRYLEITVGGETLSPRELIRSVPIAGMALTVPDGAIGTDQLADEATTQMVLVESSIQINNDTTTWEDMPDMVVTITTRGGPVLISFFTHYRRSVASGAGIILRLNIDGNDISGSDASYRVAAADIPCYASLTYVTELSPGTHTIKVRWRMSGVNATGTLRTDVARQLSVINFKK